MKDETDEKEDTVTVGAFPKKLFNHIENVNRGMYIDVRVFSDETIVISPVVPTEEERQKADIFTKELLDLLEELRGDSLLDGRYVDSVDKKGN